MAKKTRDDVARLAQVSTATVSRVYNDPHKVSQDKVERVLKAAKELVYSPNKQASALRRKGSGIILFLEPKRAYVADAKKYYYTFYADVIKGVKSVVDNTMYQLSLYSFETVQDIRAIKQKRMCDAMVVYNVQHPKHLKAICGLGIPYVCCHHSAHLNEYNRSFVDEFWGGQVAAQHFLETGHRRPLHITGSLRQNWVCQDRWHGFRSKFQRKPLLLDGKLGIRGGYASGRRAVGLIKKGEVDSIFVVNDLTAIGVVHALQENRIRIPKQVSVIGYDNLPFVSTLPFRLTTVDVAIGKAFQEGTELLIQSVRTGERINHRVCPVLVRGESVAS